MSGGGRNAGNNRTENLCTNGATMVLEDDDCEDRSLTLYSRNADKTVRITLDKLPLTIGKLEGCVDTVLDDRSVSRIHCRFDKTSDGRVSIVDLNSTNGCFINRLKISPQQETIIDEGDEIRIGRITFDCR